MNKNPLVLGSIQPPMTYVLPCFINETNQGKGPRTHLNELFDRH